jgi:hypothetical protein
VMVELSGAKRSPATTICGPFPAAITAKCAPTVKTAYRGYSLLQA